MEPTVRTLRSENKEGGSPQDELSCEKENVDTERGDELDDHEPEGENKCFPCDVGPNVTDTEIYSNNKKLIL